MSKQLRTKTKGVFAMTELGPVTKMTKGGHIGFWLDAGDAPYDRYY